MEGAEENFLHLKEVLVIHPVLSLPFIIHTIVLDAGLCVVLSQVFEEKDLFISRKLTPNKQNYTIVEQEALANKWAIEELRYYLVPVHPSYRLHAPPVDGPGQRTPMHW